MSSRIRSHIRSNVVGYVALFLVLTGGSAYALDGSDTVFSDDIVDGEVRTADIRNLGVTQADLAANSVTSGKINDGGVANADIASNAVNSDKVADNSLTGQDISDNSLGFEDLAPNSVTFSEIASDTITPTDIRSIDALTGFRETCDDAVGGGPTNCIVPNFGFGNPTITVFFTCEETTPGTVVARIRAGLGVTGDTWAVDSRAPNGAKDQTGLGISDKRSLTEAGPTTGAHLQGGDYSVLATSSAGNVSAINGEATAGTHLSGHDCAFAFSAVG